VLREAFDLLRAEARFLGACDLPRAAAVIRHWLHGLPVRSSHHNPTPLAILGLLEARLMRADVTVLAGLNEGVWPGPADCGPWLNRPMRDILGMKQPEAQIGQTAHDFVQAFGNANVKLVWSRRIGDSPATPSRWIHRLLMILETAGLRERYLRPEWPALARRLSEPQAVAPAGMPKPRPPVALRPRALSVTRIERLIRDPYAIYAQHVLKLEPLKPIAAAPDPARRGIIFHGAIGDFLTAFPQALPPDVAAQLEAHGSRHFEQIADYPGLVSFWWPRFCRIARWMAETEPELRQGVERVLAERNGAIELAIRGAAFRLSCRADRIDLMSDGTARIIDYKTGSVPTRKQVESGLAPQLTLQAAILARGGFQDVRARDTANVAYVHLTGGDPAGEIDWLKIAVMDAAGRHLAELEKLLTAYASEMQAYIPRFGMEKDEDQSDYDHLSRFREWSLSGDAR
jgi:ATP-dependent helicase/nuclease subunit B